MKPEVIEAIKQLKALSEELDKVEMPDGPRFVIINIGLIKDFADSFEVSVEDLLSNPYFYWVNDEGERIEC